MADKVREIVAAHGTASRYNNGKCRCKPCRAAWAQYCRDRARARGRLSRPAAVAAKRMGFVRQRGETVHAFEKRMKQTRAWLRSEPYYADRSAAAITIHPTDLGARLLASVQARTGRDYDDIFESLIRSCGKRLTFDEPDVAEKSVA